MGSKTKNESSNKLLEFKDLNFIWQLFLKNLSIIFFMPLLAYAIGYIYTHRLNSFYGAKAQLLLKSNETYDYQDPIYQGLGAYNTYTDIQNQMRIIKSRDLIGEVVDRLNVGTSYYVVGRLKKHEVFGTLPFGCEVYVQNKSLYEVPISIEVIDVDRYRINYEIDGERVSEVRKFDEDYFSDDINLNIRRMYRYTEKNIQVIKESNYEVVFHSRDFLINKYQRAINVENIEFTSILNIDVKDELEKRAVVFLDTLTDGYIDYSMRIQLEVNQNTLENIQRQIDTVKRFIEEKEKSILHYKESKDILNISREEEQFFDDYITYSQQKRALEEQLHSINLLEEYLKSTTDERALPPYFYIEKADVYLSEAVGELRSRQTDLELKKVQYSDDNPGIQSIRKEITVKKNDIRTYLVNLSGAITEQIRDIDKKIALYKGEIQELPKSAQDIINIQRELDVNNKMYLFLLEKKTNTLIARAGIIPQVRIIEQTVSIGLVEPDKSKIIRIFVLGGFIVSLVIALIRKLFFDKIGSVAELAEVTHFNIVGGVPFVNRNMEDELVVKDQPKSQVVESFRTIRTNLNYLGDNKNRAKKYIISSYFPGEGKTFCVTNTALLMSNADKKVLIIDFDLHKPRVHKAFKISNERGLSTILSGLDDYKSVIYKFSNNLDIITAGPVPPNPSELVLKDRVNVLINELENQYDLIILDTPPFGLLHDAIELTRFADVFVIIINTRIARNSGVRRMEQLLDGQINISKGIILNGIRQKKFQYYYTKYTYKYGYSYGRYGYGYGSYGHGYDEYTN